MKNVSQATKDAYLIDGSHKELRIVFPQINVTLKNEDIVLESLKITQAINQNGDLDFCGCIASVLTFDIESNLYEIAGKSIKVFIKADNTEEIQIFDGIVDSSTKKGINEITKRVTAYDRMRRINDADVTSWYKGLTFPITIKNLRDSFFNHFSIKQKAITLINDSVTVTNNAGENNVFAKSIINSICRLNACFGQIDGNGEFKYIYLDEITEGLYPSDDLYPRNTIYPSGENEGALVLTDDYVINVNYEDYKVSKINRVIIINGEGAIGGSSGSGSNIFQIDNNILSQGFTKSQYTQVANAIYQKVSPIQYGVADVDCVGNPVVDCGDVLVFRAKTEILRTYILSRTISGIQSMKDRYSADGDVQRANKFNEVQAQINRLENKTETNKSNIAQTAKDLQTESYNRTVSEGNLSTRITQNASSITAEAKRAGEAEASLKLTADGLTSRVSNAEGNISTLTQTAQGLQTTVKSQGENIGNLSSQITQTASEVNSKVSKGSVISEINQTAEEVRIQASKINLDGYVTAENLTTRIAQASRIEVKQLSVTGDLTAFGNSMLTWRGKEIGTQVMGQLTVLVLK